ncbi:MAG: cyclic nucleotide-binding domain-containing protein [Bryobacteraceae bacterium]|jgi:CRP-like cAMP-binding protein
MLLRSANVFQDLEERMLQAIEAISTTERHGAGTYLFQSGDAATSLHILIEGRVRLCVSRGGHIAHTITQGGEALGWSSVAGFERYSASAECITPTTSLRIPAEDLSRMLEAEPASGLKFFRRLVVQVGHRLFESYGETLSMQGKGGPGSYG